MSAIKSAVLREQRDSRKQDYGVKDPWSVDSLSIELSENVLAYADYLDLQYGAETSARYLSFQIDVLHRSGRTVGYQRSIESVIDYQGKQGEKLMSAIDDLLHPDQLPISPDDIVLKLGDKGIRVGRQKIVQIMNRLADVNQIRKHPNPWRGGRTWLYSHPDFVSTVKTGDRVVQLTRRHKKQAVSGIVLGWRLERTQKKPCPLVEFDRPHGKSVEYADPHSLIIVERPRQPIVEESVNILGRSISLVDQS